MALFGKRELLIAALLTSLVLASLYAAGLSAELSALRDQARRLQTCTKDENGMCAQQDEPEESDEAVGLVARVMSGGLVLFCCVAPSLAVRVLRAMPAVAQESRDGSSSGGAGEGKLKQYSRLDVVRYRLEYWFSTSAFSKPLALLLMTVWLALLGAGFLYAFTGAAWRVVLWRAVAVLGLDWTLLVKTAKERQPMCSVCVVSSWPSPARWSLPCWCPSSQTFSRRRWTSCAAVAVM
jgi:hypothetical protein